MTPIEMDSLAAEYGPFINVSEEEVPYIKTEQDLIRKLRKNQNDSI